MTDNLRMTVQLALEVARTSNPDVERIKAADAHPDVIKLVSWLDATPEDLKTDASELAARKIAGLIGGDPDFWAVYLELSPLVGHATFEGGEDTEETRDHLVALTPEPAPAPAKTPTEDERRRAMAELAPWVRTMSEGRHLTALVSELKDVGVQASLSGLEALLKAESGVGRFYVPSARQIDELRAGLSLLMETSAPEAQTATQEEAWTPPRLTQDAPQVAEDLPFPEPRRTLTPIPTTRKGRLRYVREKLKNEGEISINALSAELGLNNVGTASQLMAYVPGAKHIGNGVWRAQ